MTQKRKVEVFTAGCPVCDETVKMVKSLICKNCELTVYNLNDSSKSDEYLGKFKQYGAKRLPVVVVDGEIADCCACSGPTVEGLRAAGVGEGGFKC